MKLYYQDSHVTIYHGDCRDVEPSTWPKFHLLLTDPPYGIDYASQPTTGLRKRGLSAESWDEYPVELNQLLRLLLSADEAVIWGGNYYRLPISRGWLVWAKPDAPPSMGNVELAWTSRDMNSKHIIHSIAATNPERLGHPTQKPLAVMSWALSFFPGCESVFDPFMGSGTALRAAKDHGIKSVGIELEERYCEIAARRMAQEVFDFGQ